jgi:hypothetical protein
VRDGRKGDLRLDNKVTDIIVHMAHSHGQLARILEAKREVVANMGRLIEAIPDDHGSQATYEEIIENSSGITKSLTTYLNSLAELEEALAGNLTHVIKELNPGHEGE